MKKMEINQFDSSITRHIKSSQKQITILFTDIENSTKYWDEHGDVYGRLMVNAHNRLLFPIIKKFKGKVIKTIGDSIMASFTVAEQAIKAGIAIQQILYKKRHQDQDFTIKVRVGIHTGLAIVEQGDVFGDVVNVASRVESMGNGSEIAVSNDTIKVLEKGKFKFSKGDKFIPKGKKQSLTYYFCLWRKEKTLTDSIRIETFLPFTQRQKIEFLIFAVVSICSLYYFFNKYIRYLILDSEEIALLSLNLQSFVNIPIYVMIIIAVVAALLLGLLIRLTTMPTIVLRSIRGTFVFCIAYFLLFLPLSYFHSNIDERLGEIIIESDHLFIEVLENNTAIRSKPAENSKSIKVVNKGDLLLLSSVVKNKGITWNKTIIGKKQFGWVPRVLPPKMGIPEKRISLTLKFYLKMYDTIALCFGGVLFIWGFFSFKVKPV